MCIFRIKLLNIRTASYDLFAKCRRICMSYAFDCAHVVCRDVEVEAGSGGSGPFSVEAEARKNLPLPFPHRLFDLKSN